jgi:negative modulator of initiation of replication
MATLQVDDDVYQFLLRNTSRFGETESEILRRLLQIPLPSNGNGRGSRPLSPPGTTDAVDLRSQELLRFVRAGEFRVVSDANKRYLTVLGKVNEQNPTRFAEIRQAVSGRNRIYFSARREDITASGSSTGPQQIPGSSYWALTNENVIRKRRMLQQVLEYFEYDPGVIEEVVSTLQKR